MAKLDVCIDLEDVDVRLPPREPPPPVIRILEDGTVVEEARRPLAGATEKMWNIGQTVRVKFLGGGADLHNQVRDAATEWTEHANVKFAFIGKDEQAEIRIAFRPGSSSSRRGRDALGFLSLDQSETMNLGLSHEDPRAFRATALHEFGHALGLVHEHSSPSADIQWNRPVVYQALKDEMGWSKAQVDLNVFKKYSAREITNYSAFDAKSIMLYPIPKEWTKDGFSTEDNLVLSPTDKAYIKRWYPPPVTPGIDADGVLRPLDDCDEVEFHVNFGVTDVGVVEFSLDPGGDVRWWKAIEVPHEGGYRMYEMQDGDSSGGTIPFAELDRSRPIRFWKAKAFGVHTRLDYTWDVLSAIKAGGSRITLTWRRDHC